MRAHFHSPEPTPWHGLSASEQRLLWMPSPSATGCRSNRNEDARQSVRPPSASIDNMGARAHRRVSMTILMSADTALDHLLQFRDRLHDWLTEQPHVVRDRVGVHVHQVT